MVQKNLSLAPEVADRIETLAEHENRTQAEIVERAVKNYDGDSFETEVNEKLDAIMAATGAGDGRVRSHSSENKSDEEPERTGAPDSITPDMSREELPPTLQGEGYSVDEKTIACAIDATDGRSYVNEQHLTESIQDIWSETGPSNPTLNTYVDRVSDWLQDNGWYYVPAVEEWYADEEAWKETVREEYENWRQKIQDLSVRSDPERIAQTKKEAAALGNTATDAGHITNEDVSEMIQKASKLEKAAKKNSNRDGRRGGGEKDKNLKNSAFR